MAYLDNDGLLYLWQKLKGKFDNKVDKVSGKGLSTNDYTTAEKTKLSGLSNYTLPNATDSTLGGVKVGSGLSVSSGTVSVTTEFTSAEKTKLGAFDSADKYALKTDITSAVRYKGTKSTVANLPSSGNTTGDMWNVSENDMNYVWNGSSWDAMSGTVTVDAITNAEIDTIVAS